MKFEDALSELRKGKPIKRESYANYIYPDEKFYTLKILIGDLLCDDWIVYEEPGKSFPEVFEEFKDGKKIRRKSWESPRPDKYMHNNSFEVICTEDLLSTDWEVIY